MITGVEAQREQEKLKYFWPLKGTISASVPKRKSHVSVKILLP
jgi:hypothetical protein